MIINKLREPTTLEIWLNYFNDHFTDCIDLIKISTLQKREKHLSYQERLADVEPYMEEYWGREIYYTVSELMERPLKKLYVKELTITDMAPLGKVKVKIKLQKESTNCEITIANDVRTDILKSIGNLDFLVNWFSEM